MKVTTDSSNLSVWFLITYWVTWTHLSTIQASQSSIFFYADSIISKVSCSKIKLFSVDGEVLFDKGFDLCKDQLLQSSQLVSFYRHAFYHYTSTNGILASISSDENSEFALSVITNQSVSNVNSELIRGVGLTDNFIYHLFEGHTTLIEARNIDLSFAEKMKISGALEYKTIGHFYDYPFFYIAISIKVQSSGITKQQASLIRFEPEPREPFKNTIHMELSCDTSGNLSPGHLALREISVTSQTRTLNYLVSADQSSSSVLCHKSLDQVDSYLNESLKNCQSGLGDDAIISRHLSIGFQEPPVVSRRCSFYDLGKPLYLPALTPATSKAFLPFSLTHLESSFYQNHEIFVGLRSNHEMIVFLTSPLFQQLSRQQLGSDSDILMSNSKIITSSSADPSIFTYPVIECSVFYSCASCLEHGVSLCSWCLLRGTCNLVGTCAQSQVPIEREQMNTNDAGDKCPFVSSFQPRAIPTRSSTLVNFFVDHLPQTSELSNQGIGCQLPRKEMYSKAEVSTFSYQINPMGTTSVQCIVTFHEVVAFPEVEVNLIFGSSDVVLTNFTVPIDPCSRFSESSCSQCVESRLNCFWCPSSEKCFDSSNNSATVCAFTPLSEFKQCPVALQISSDGSEFDSNEEVNLVIAVRNIIQTLPVHCRFKFRNWVFSSPGIIIGQDSVYCDPIKLRFDESSINGITVYNVDVKQNLSTFDNPNQLKISIYECVKMATTCSSCSSLFQKYNCAWCHESLSCSSLMGCEGDFVVVNQAECREPPVISEFQPQSGPVAGGTELRIFGKNFGSNSDYIKNISIGPVECSLKAVYLISNNLDSIICITDTAPFTYTDSVKVEVLSGLEGQSKSFFEFREPVVQHYFPKLGPRSGGSLVQIVGVNLDIGTNHFVNFETTQVQIYELTPHYVTFYTPALPTNESWVNYQIDDGIYHVGRFVYQPDPIIDSYHPNFSISAGGINITFQGKNFDFIFRAKLTIHVQRRQSSTWFVYVSDCDSVESSKILCPTPSMEEIFPHKLVKVGLKLDGFEYLDQEEKFSIIPTPTFQTFDQIYLIQDNSVIKIYGSNISSLLHTSHFTVYLDKQPACPLVRVNSAENFIECEISMGAYPTLEGSKPLLVSIRMGNNVLYNLGYVRLNQESDGIPLLVLFGVTVSTLCFVATIAILWYAWRACNVQDLYVIK